MISGTIFDLISARGRNTVWTLISWLYQKSFDLDQYFFRIRHLILKNRYEHGALSRTNLVFFLGPLTLRHPGIPSFNYNVNVHGLASAN